MALRPIDTFKIELEVKKSKFIGIGFPINSVDESRSMLKNLKEEYADSRHICYGFLWGEKSTHMGMSDDGEPSGTAGRPILEVLKGSGYENILVAVIRYFGGIKLGTGGLVKAYTEVTKLVVDGIHVEKYIERIEATLLLPYPLYNQVKMLIESYKCIIIEEKFETNITIKLSLEVTTEKEFSNDLQEISNGTLTLRKN